MPLNGPIQADGQQLKAAHTQKPPGSREGCSPGVAHGKGGRPTTKGSVKTSLWTQWHPPGANCTAQPTPKRVTEADDGTTCRRPRGLEAIKIQQTTYKQNTLFFTSTMGLWTKELMGASLCLSCT